MADPKISVILPAWNSHDTVAACLESLRKQTFREFEVVLVDSSANRRTAEIVQARFPEVVYHPTSERLSAHAARNCGAAIARGSILVFSDPDCLMHPDWLERLSAVTQEHSFVGGAVANAAGGWFENAVHLTKYAWWLPGGLPQARPEIPSANMALTRSLFSRIGPIPEDWCGDTLLSHRAATAGVTPWFEPAAMVRHDHRVTFIAFVKERFLRGYDYGLVRPRVSGWSRARCLMMALLFPVVAAVMTLRALQYAALAGNLRPMILALPVVVLGYTVRAIGEASAHGRLVWRGL